MLTQYDIDILKQQIDDGQEVYLYYVAHMIEPREGLLDEHIYKSSSQFKVVKVRLLNIANAYFEVLNYLKTPSDYHTEEEECYYDHINKYINRYIVPGRDGASQTYTKDFTSRIPSIIYGYRREIYDTVAHTKKIVTDPSPVKVQYINALEYGDMSNTQALDAFNDGKLDWKYQKLSTAQVVDGIAYDYITSDWYMLDIQNFPRTEMPLVNVKQLSAYFTDLSMAFDYIDQLKA